VNKLLAGATVTFAVTVAPVLSRITMGVVPAAIALIVRLFPLRETVAMLVFALVTVYGAVPPPTLYVAEDPLGRVTPGDAVVYKSRVGVDDTVTAMTTVAPTLSMSWTSPLPAASPVIVRLPPVSTAEIALVLLLVKV